AYHEALRQLLSRSPNSLGIGKGHTGAAFCAAARYGKSDRDSGSRRPSPPVREKGGLVRVPLSWFEGRSPVVLPIPDPVFNSLRRAADKLRPGHVHSEDDASSYEFPPRMQTKGRTARRMRSADEVGQCFDEPHASAMTATGPSRQAGSEEVGG